MGKICTINGQPYLVFLPSGWENEFDHDSQLYEIIDFLGEDCDNIFHWIDMYSWGQDTPSIDSACRVIFGYYSIHVWGMCEATHRDKFIGFRPVLTPLDTKTLKPAPSLLDDIPDGSRFALTSLYMNGKAVPAPQNPTEEGDIADYIPCAEISFGDRDSAPMYWVHVIKHKDLLWVDRNILKMISWEDLQKQGYIGGKN